MTLDDLIYKPGLLQGERILVTGGGTGLGRVMAEAFLMMGADIYLCGRRGAVVEQTAQELVQQHGGRATGHACDVRQPEAVEQMIEAIWADGGALTGLVNNAAGNFVSRTEDLSMRAFDAVANIVMRGSFNLTLECGRRWLAEGRKASVLSILTTWVWNGSAFTVPSAMAKSGVHAMTQSLAVEWGNRGIRFNAIAPGLFPTEGMSARLNPQGGEHVRADNPMGRNGRMPELANLAVFLMSRQAEYLTGQTIAIDGGQYQATGGNFAGLASWSDQDWANARSAIESRNAADRQQRTA
ncbi:short-chain dehydrogenase/reductase SDR [Delftia acidovorans SPH-1]|uniref:Short-chain dehydrogenase/reductase SDR n=1 Tax=Delftia acidovorans (strain DSM 14801 / SPH-1) TaxID=398578 RepID=A9BMB2_DELAS|nr:MULTISPECIES: SDR family oxidoreductase [Delftia]MCP4018971.1 SDR family oxidoreductase [Delftia sp.]OLE95629.1 MAG: short-chain dehydrogenase [Delftia sp. 13_1_40CM_3_66_6]ABX37457.1 short-chain dehydrogenase/reductase SDR [Delftia acidovorans SPH-1]MBN9323859.1 SDR family oxidoreductase [Delftia acidovorans]MCP4516330.1 SDR family oxidoreductase [Delftia sp.]